MRTEVNVILRVDSGRAADTSSVRGEIESRFGRRPFGGWLELMTQLEAVVDRARAEAAERRREAVD